MKTLSIDIETYSDIPLQKTGVYRYSGSPNFEILLFGYSIDSGPVQVVDLTCGEHIPKEVLAALEDDSVIKWAFNAAFERVCLSRYLGYPTGEYLDPESWHCSMVWAATMGLPLSLEGVGAVLPGDGEAGEMLKDILSEYGLHCMGIAENGFRELTNSVREIRSVEDMKNLKIRVAGSNLLMECYKRWGADATNMNWSETYTALQQKTVEGQENPLPAIDAASVQEVQPYCSLWNANYDCLFFCINPVRKADRQLRCLHRVAKACRLNAKMQHLAVRQYKDLLPGTGDALHIHHDDAVGSKDHLIAHRLVGAHDALAVQKQCAGIFADILFLKADEVFHWFITEFHGFCLLSLVVFYSYCSIPACSLQDAVSPFASCCAILYAKKDFVRNEVLYPWRSLFIRLSCMCWTPPWTPLC